MVWGTVGSTVIIANGLECGCAEGSGVLRRWAFAARAVYAAERAEVAATVAGCCACVAWGVVVVRAGVTCERRGQRGWLGRWRCLGGGGRERRLIEEV